MAEEGPAKFRQTELVAAPLQKQCCFIHDRRCFMRLLLMALMRLTLDPLLL